MSLRITVKNLVSALLGSATLCVERRAVVATALCLTMCLSGQLFGQNTALSQTPEYASLPASDQTSSGYPLYAKLNPPLTNPSASNATTLEAPALETKAEPSTTKLPKKTKAKTTAKSPPKKAAKIAVKAEPSEDEEADEDDSESDNPEQKAESKKPGYYPQNWDVYRDQNPYPIDPRKPCHPCVSPIETRPRTHLALPGLKGRPYSDREPGACNCGKRSGVTKKPNYSPYWPSVFNAKFEEHFPRKAAKRAANFCKPRLNDVFNKFGTFKLIDYHRCDLANDPYGCLGESKQLLSGSGVAGVGFRQPGQPVNRGFHFPQ